jgi:hypothetical protein
MVEGRQDSEELSEQAIVVHKLMYEQVDFLKKQQWTITNYIALIYAAIFAVTKELGSTPPSLKCILLAAALIACGYGLLALWIVQVDLTDERKRLDKANREIFGDKEYSELGLEAHSKPYWRGMFFTWALMLVLVVGAVIVTSYVYMKTN